ncbi:hypothetical protein VCRA2111O136_110165 [Vibrio crassostreae]|nr:hypothetical protein VCRA2110O135_80180 [Vibrio crassostreae]CAK2402311.1 hypothetical protein VCRA2111O136_110165 [Vibrio crassostreae]CAK2907304.1 hypothetical protein VCRA217O134_290039 [Vibrio crassostreae]
MIKPKILKNLVIPKLKLNFGMNTIKAPRINSYALEGIK